MPVFRSHTVSDGLGDAQLVVAAQAGGPDGRTAFDTLVRRHQNWVYTYALHLLRAPGLADDAAQETFVRAWTNLGRLKNPRTFRGWLRTIATRQAFNLRRARGTRSRLEEGAPPPSATPSVLDVVATQDLLDQALDRLAYGFREVMILRYVEDLSMEEIGAVLGLRRSAVKMRLLRAREAFLAAYNERSSDAK